MLKNIDKQKVLKLKEAVHLSKRTSCFPDTSFSLTR